jgi:hypothetical protein
MNPYIATTSEEVLDKFNGQTLVYNPHRNFDITHPDTTWIYNNYGDAPPMWQHVQMCTH